MGDEEILKRLRGDNEKPQGGYGASHAVTRVCLRIGDTAQDLRLADRSRVTENCHARMCVQLRLVCSAGVSPVRVRIRSPVAWMAGRGEGNRISEGH